MPVLSLSELPEPIILRGHLLEVVQGMCGGTGYALVVSAAKWEWQLLGNANFFFNTEV